VWAYWAVWGVVLGAAYLLWLYQRVFWGKITNPENEHLQDLNGRELATLVPLVALCFAIGLYPAPFLRFIEKPLTSLSARIDAARSAQMAAAAAPVVSSIQ
jgi:NADH-quinone oxidoreductase subunit M